MTAVATPKQIRELMKVEDLTNDEIKSHLQVCILSLVCFTLGKEAFSTLVQHYFQSGNKFNSHTWQTDKY